MKRLIKKIFRTAGFEVHRQPTIVKSLNIFKIDLVLDIGANIGQYALELRDVGYSGKIVSFEPLSDAHLLLSKAASKDGNWTVFDRCAIGDINGEITINISGNSVSSSILPMLETHRLAAVDSAYISKELTPIHTLDIVAPRYIAEARNYFIKIDTQGFEWQVLEGAAETIKHARGIMLELSLEPLYQGQRLWREIIDFLISKGFTLWAIQKGFTDQNNGRSLQIDIIFFRLDKITD